jgi:hypothetical protein
VFVYAPQQQMERRSDRIRKRHERATESQVHEAEEQTAPPPRGRQNRGNRGHHNKLHPSSRSYVRGATTPTNFSAPEKRPLRVLDTQGHKTA